MSKLTENMKIFENKVTGGTFRTQIYDGITFPLKYVMNPKQRLSEIMDMQCRDDDVFVISYPKSGTNWVKEIVYMIKNQSTDYSPCGRANSDICWLDMDTINNIPSPRVMYSHLHFRHLPKDHKARRGKVIAVFRDPRDVITSHYHYFNRVALQISFEEMFTLTMNGRMSYGNWFDWKDTFEKENRENPDYPLLILKYEDLIKDLKREIIKIADFLGADLEDEKLTAISGACKFSAVKKGRPLLPQTILYPLKNKDEHPIYRKGVCGDWKNHFTVAQFEEINRVMKKSCNKDSIVQYYQEV